MESMNNTCLIGRLTRDADLKYTSNGTAIADMSIAANYRKKEGSSYVEGVSFFDIKVFGVTAEKLNAYLKKGKQIAVMGALRQDRWSKDGKNMSKIYIIAHKVELLGSKSQEVITCEDVPF